MSGIIYKGAVGRTGEYDPAERAYGRGELWGKDVYKRQLQYGVYNHIAGDGRELVIADETAFKLRAEDGRSIANVDISPFIGHLPNKKDTRHFSSEDASGSTSQAANLMESMESGTKLLLIDEDTSATNFMAVSYTHLDVYTRPHYNVSLGRA